MPRLLQRVSNMTGRCLSQRPSRDEYRGINHDSIQAIGLMAWWPLWETMSKTQIAPPAMDYGPVGLHMVPSANTLHVGEASMGSSWLGSVAPAGISGLRSWQSHSRPYANGATNLVDPVDFGALPQATVFATAYMSTAWVKIDEDARRFRNGAPLDAYIYTFDRNDAFGFPGHTLGAIMRIPNGGASTALASATVFDNDDAGSVPFGVQSLQIINDGYWHLICGLYIPIGFTGGSAYGTGQQYVFVDGEIENISGNDVQVPATAQPFGFSKSQVNMGSPQSGAHAASTAVTQFIGSDDDGVSSSWVGYLGDHRLYSYDFFLSGTGKGLDIVEFARSQARSMYHPETRWELYQPRTPRGSARAVAQSGGNNIAWVVA